MSITLAAPLLVGANIVAQDSTVDPTLDRLFDALENGSEDRVRGEVADLHRADISLAIDQVHGELRQRLWDLLPARLLGETITELSEGAFDDLVTDTPPERLAEALKPLDVDDLVDILPYIPEAVVADVLWELGQDERRAVREVLSYSEDTAGGLMNIDTVTIREGVTVAVVLRYLRRLAEMPDYTDKLFVVDNRGRLKGEVTVNELLTHDPATPIAALVDDDPVYFNTDDEDDAVANAFQRYDLVSAAVTDSNRVLLGRITIDDVVDVIRKQADQAAFAAAGVREDEDLLGPVSRTARSRAVWLGVNLITAVLAAWVISFFESTIDQLVALAVLMPIVPSMGGNAGTQTLAVVIRALGVGTITERNLWRVFRKEMMVGALNGLLWAIAAGAIAIFWYGDPKLAAIIALAMVVNLIAANAAGVLIPVIFDRLKIDPALASGVLLTTITDVVGFLALLGMAALWLL
ncbi:magnesium transporter [Gammaproteobacteria bacterium]|nr:magnesium transporter [Gammaproteobacteria bacterium]